MANRYDTNLILDRIADALDDDQNSALIDALTTIANAISQSGGGDIPSGGTMGQLLGKRSNQDFDVMWYDNLGDDALSNQASEYNPQSNYVVGDYCLHTRYLYKCTSPTTGNWDSTCWNRVQFGGEISAINEVTNPALTPIASLSVYVMRKHNRNMNIWITGSGLITPSTNGWVDLASLPSGDQYVPFRTIDFACVNNRDDTALHGRVEDGKIRVYGKANVSMQPIVFIEYITKA